MVQSPMKLNESGPFFGKDLSVFSSNMLLPRHRWYEFKEGFSAALVDEALRSASGRQKDALTILDPFSGCGTTLLSSISAGHRAVGIEVNPFLTFASRAKCVPGVWDRSEFLGARDIILGWDISDGISHLESYSTFTQKEGADKWLFNLEVLRAFWASQKALTLVPPHFRGPFRLALLGAALECSNVKRDGKCLRYRKDWKTLAADNELFCESFRQRCEMIYEDVCAWPLSDAGRLEVYQGDTRKILGSSENNLQHQSVDLVVTSPPYLNSFDYCDVYRPELFLGGFVSSNNELRAIRLQTVRSHVQVAWTKTQAYQSPLLRTYVKSLREASVLWSPHLPDMVQAYFDDMHSVLGALHHYVRPAGQVWFVVSTSAYAGIEIPVDLLLAEVGEAAGFHLDSINVLRRLRSSGQHWQGQGTKPPLRESLIIWRKPRKGAKSHSHASPRRDATP